VSLKALALEGHTLRATVLAERFTLEAAPGDVAGECTQRAQMASESVDLVYRYDGTRFVLDTAIPASITAVLALAP